MAHAMDDGTREIAVKNSPDVDQMKDDAENKKASY